MLAEMDHLVVGAASLGTARNHLERTVSLPTVAGGAHAVMGTHNRLMSLGSGLYAEALAVDPKATAPDHPRWFGMDRFCGDDPAAPALVAWALRVDDMDAALAEAPDGIGRPWDVTRGTLRWQITVPADGYQPFDGVFPALICWEGSPPVLDNSGARLLELTLRHPDAEALSQALSKLVADARISVVEGTPGLSARIGTPDGERSLS